jgi:hypothetical protein
MKLSYLNRKICLHFCRLQHFSTTNLVRNVSVGEIGRGKSGHAFYFSLPSSRKQRLHLKVSKEIVVYSLISFDEKTPFLPSHLAC